jgi:hypothetical protein
MAMEFMSALGSSLLIWGIALIISLIVVIVIAKRALFTEGIGIFLFFFGIWAIGGVLALVVGLIAQWNWVSFFVIASICSVAAAIVLGSVEGERWTDYGLSALYGAVSGFFLKVTFMLIMSMIHNGRLWLGAGAYNVLRYVSLRFIYEMGYMADWINLFVFAVVGAVLGLIVAVFANVKKRQRREQARIQNENEQRIATEQRDKEIKQRAYEQWEKTEESEIKNLFK